MNYVTFLPARGVGTAVPEPSWKASAGLEAHAANKTFDLLKKVRVRVMLVLEETSLTDTDAMTP